MCSYLNVRLSTASVKTIIFEINFHCTISANDYPMYAHDSVNFSCFISFPKLDETEVTKGQGAFF